MKLTASIIKNATHGYSAKGNHAPCAKRYSDGRNLYLNVSPTNAKSWLFIYRAANGKQRELGLGSFTGDGAAYSVGLQAARLAADAARMQLAMGIDPIDAKIAARVSTQVSSITFADLIADAIAVAKQKWTPEADGTYTQEIKWVRSFEQHAAKLMTKKVATITDVDVLAVVKPIWTTKAQTATRLLYRIEKVLELAIGRKLLAGTNPAKFTGLISAELGVKAGKKSATGGHKAMHYDAMPAFWPLLTAGTGMGSKALAFVILTAVRTDEARLALWSEVDFDKGVWTVPACRMKNGEAHEVPLSTQAIELLRSIPRQVGNDFIFTGVKKGSSIGSSALNDRLCDPVSNGGLDMQGKATVHGMRKTFRNWAGDKLRGYTTQDFEMCLAHSLGAVEGAYRTLRALETRREIMQAWANYATAKSNVIQLAA